jgi:hypothetical protein
MGPNEAVAGGLRESIPKRREWTFPDKYYYMTELTNPVEAFYRRQNPDFQAPRELGRKLARGNMLHNLASYWFRELPDFVVDEGTVDGAFVDIDGVRGRIDYLIGDSIIEFKSKDENPEDVDEVLRYYVNDLEQLVFYAAIHPQNPTTNYLVFMENVYPYKLKAFRVDIKGIDAIKKLLSERIALFSDALKKGNPSNLGRCRYFELGCRFDGSDICSCSDMKLLDTSILCDNISIEYDADYTKTLEEIRGDAVDESINCYTTYDILLPRKHHMSNVRGMEPIFQADPRKEEYKTCLGDTIYNFKREFKAELTPEEKQEVRGWKKDKRVKIGNRWMKVKKSGKPDGVITPYIVKVSNAPYRKYARKPSDYSIAELGIICSIYGQDNGLICTVYPKLGDMVNVFEIRFKSTKKIRRIVRDVIEKIEKARETDDLLSLPKCPEYMNNDGKCPLIEECKD